MHSSQNSHREPASLYFQLTTDELDDLRLHGTYTFQSVSSSDGSASDRLGAGRTLGNWISRAGRRLESAAHVTSLTSEPTPYFVFDTLDDLEELNHTHSFEVLTDSDGKSSNRIGVGRTLGNWISHAGRNLEKLLGRSAERLGKGPNAIMYRALVSADSRRSSKPRERHLAFYSPPPFQQLVERALFPGYGFGSDLYDPNVVHDPKFIKSCDQLVLCLRNGNQTIQYLAIYYISALLCAIPECQPIFRQANAQEVIKQVLKYSSMFPRSNVDHTLLFSPSTRALVMLSESQVLGAIKDLDLVSKDRIVADSRSLASISQLIKYTVNPESNLLAARRLQLSLKRLLPSVADMTRLISPSVVDTWAKLALDLDPLCSIIFTRLLEVTFVMDNAEIANLRLGMVTSILKYGLREGRGVFISPQIRKLLHPQLYSEKLFAATIRDSTRFEMEQVVQKWQRTELTPAESDLLAPFVQFISPFFSLWGAFCQEWYFDSDEEWIRSDGVSHLRFIPPKRRKRLCRLLVHLALSGRCFVNDVVQVAQKDVDCYETILQILRLQCTAEDVQIRDKAIALVHTISSQLSDVVTPFPTSYTLGFYHKFCVGLRRTASSTVVGRLTGEIKVSRCHVQFGFAYTRQPAYPYLEVLLGPLDSLRWIDASLVQNPGIRYKPVLAAVDTGGERHYVGCALADLGLGKVIEIFAVGQDFSLPDSFASNYDVFGPVHVLATRTSPNGQPSEIYWCNPKTQRFTHAVSWEEADVPDWIWQGYCQECWAFHSFQQMRPVQRHIEKGTENLSSN
ncbi:hypothetical protein JAAARDRAFT_212205 [Jaapia argillacea MUCL 33604]|uniref:Uncharacterized protein n=1 Tax=Jaapia argillacea MUCL 33604 TaxID=933084 RepID=A0A067PGC2_9AGAM|nr:hypothetical protein JAAARDRAFT_212205 [Jaapia argillacea MUCL 33604]